MSKLVSSFLFGPFLLILGLIMKIYPPKKPNNFYGYRTSRSMKSKAAWRFANSLSSNIFIIAGILLCLISYLSWHYDEEDFVIINLIGLLLSIGSTVYFTEKALKKNFDDEGKPRL